MQQLETQQIAAAARMSPERLSRIISGAEPLNVVSYGGGLHSTAMLVQMVQSGKSPDLVLFADTGDELAETYATVEFYKRWCEARGIEFVIVKNAYGVTLGEYVKAKHILPSRTRRDCTTKFKIAPMNRYLRTRFGRKAIFSKSIGYDYDEIARASKASRKRIVLSPGLWAYGGSKSPKYELMNFPLIAWKMDRVACAKVLTDLSLPVPQKSGCTFCPFTKKMGFVWLYFKHRDQYDYAMGLEENSNEFYKPKGQGQITLSGYGLRHLAKWIEANRAELEGKFKAMGDNLAEKDACLFARGISKGTGI